MALRCQCRNVSNQLICKNKSNDIFYLNNKRCCNIHMNFYTKKYATLIQSCYRGYRKRKYLNNVYINLPDDIQNRILYFTRLDFYLNKLNIKLQLLVTNKIDNYIREFNHNYNIDRNINFTLLNYLTSNKKNIIHIYSLYIKYKCILDQRFNHILKNNLNYIHGIIQVYEHKIFNAYTSNIFDLTCVLYNRLKNILS